VVLVDLVVPVVPVALDGVDHHRRVVEGRLQWFGLDTPVYIDEFMGRWLQ